MKMMENIIIIKRAKNSPGGNIKIQSNATPLVYLVPTHSEDKQNYKDINATVCCVYQPSATALIIVIDFHLISRLYRAAMICIIM